MTLPTKTRAILFHGVWLRRFVLALPAIAIWLVAAPAQAPAAEPWPTRPVTVLCPFAAGTSTDTLMRLINASLSQRFRPEFHRREPPRRNRQYRRRRGGESRA